MRIIYDNLVEDATITSYSEHPQMTWEDALLDTRLSRLGRTIGVDDEWIKFSFTSAVSASYCLIYNHNITASATVTIQGNATDVWTSPSLEETLTIDDVCYADWTSASYQYWRLYIDDPTNTDEYIQLSKVVLGPSLQMPSFSNVFECPRLTNSSATKSPSGQLYGDKRITYDAPAGFTFDNVSEANRLLINAWFNEIHNVKPFSLIVWENDLDIQLPVWVNCINEKINWQKNKGQGVRWNMELGFEECF